MDFNSHQYILQFAGNKEFISVDNKGKQ
jgi:hypothetical protein